MNNSTIEARRLTVEFAHHQVLSEFSHVFKPGRWTHVIGPNGAGKSTLLKALLGLVSPSQGSVLLNSRPLDEYSFIQRAQTIAYVPQRLDSLPSMRAISFVAQGLFVNQILGGMPESESIDRAFHALNLLGLTGHADRCLDELSGGECQLCILASAIAQNTNWILLDEPTSALDIQHTQRLTGVLQSLVKQGKGIISVTHDLALAAQTADQTIVLSQGQIIGNVQGFPGVSVLSEAWGCPPSSCGGIVLGKEPLNHELHAGSDLLNTADCIPNTHESSHRGRYLLLISIALLLLCLMFCPLVGATHALPWGDETQRMVFFQLRIPRVLWGAFCGAVLSMVGASFQALFQNPLATPYTLGVASGASLGAIMAIQFGLSSIFGLSALACIGGIAVMLGVVTIASRFDMRSPLYCLLAGVAASMFCSACGMAVQSFASPMTAHQMMRWQMGGLEIAGFDTFSLFPILAICMGGLFYFARPLNLMSVDSQLACARGVNITRVQTSVIIAAGLATSISVSMCGPIGFIGLVIPNAIRRFYDADLRRMLPACALLGAVTLVTADTFARLIEGVAWISVGVVIAIIGAPLFIYILFKTHKKRVFNAK